MINLIVSRNIFRPLLGVLLGVLLVSCSEPKKEPTPVSKPVVNPELVQVQKQIAQIQDQMKPIFPRLVEIENAARTNHPELQKLFSEMTAKQLEYEAKLDELPEMKAIHDELEAKQAELNLALDKQYKLNNQEIKQ